MTRDEGNHGHRHPDAVAYLEGLTEGDAAVHPPVVREHDGGFAQCWLEGGEVRSRDITEEELPLAGFRPDGGRFRSCWRPFRRSSGRSFRSLRRTSRPAFPTLTAWSGRSATAPLASALKLLLERLDGMLPTPESEGCGKPMRRHPATGKSFLTRLGRIEVERAHFHCRSCGKGRFPPDRALGLEGGAFTPGMASVMAGTVPMTGFEAASGRIANLAGVDASPSSLQRRSLALGEEALRFEREEAVEGRPLEPRMHLSIDGTGIPMRKEETEGVRGKHEDGSSKTREARLAVMYTAEGRDPETGAALKDRGSETSGCLIDSAAAPSGSREPSGFATRLDREALRRGLHDAGELVVISDGAEWIRNACDELFGGRKVIYVLDLFHSLEHASDAVKAIVPERDRRLEGIKADIEAGRVAKVIRELEPFSGRHEEVEACCRYFRKNIERMRYDGYRDQGMQVGSGAGESGCRQFGLRLKRSGTRWSRRGANAMPALKSCVMNLRLPDFLDWQAKQATV